MQLHITRAEKKRLARPPGLWGAPALHIFALPIEACGQRVRGCTRAQVSCRLVAWVLGPVEWIKHV